MELRRNEVHQISSSSITTKPNSSEVRRIYCNRIIRYSIPKGDSKSEH